MGLPVLGVGEEIWVLRGYPRGGEQHVGGGDGVGGAVDGHGGFDFAHDGVNGRVHAKGFFDDLGVEREALEGVVC